MKLTRCKLEWKVEDFWIGVFWRHGNAKTDDGDKRLWTDVWICVVPCVPLHLTFMHDISIKF